MMMCIVGAVIKNDEPTENYQLNLQLPSASCSFTVGFSSLFICLLLWFGLTVHRIIFRETSVKSHCPPSGSAADSRQTQSYTSW